MIGERDAAGALAEVERTRRRAIELSGYARAGDMVLAWGLVWLVCNSLTYFAPTWGPNSWPVGIALATAVCIVRGARRTHTVPAALGRINATVGIAIGFMALTMVIGGVSDPRQVNAIISLYIAASYLAMGVWTGTRFLWAGLAIVAIVLAGWFADRDHFYLWMGIGGGGVLIATGLWLRRA